MRKTQKCGIYEINGHNQKSCQVRRNSQTLLGGEYGIKEGGFSDIVESWFRDDNEDFNVDW